MEKEYAKKRYGKGRNYEYKAIKFLKELGFDICQRTAGSHSPIDVLAIDTKKKIIRFVQVKGDNISKKDEEKIMLENSKLNGDFKVEFEVWSLE